jgi:hypothetical protein
VIDKFKLIDSSDLQVHELKKNGKNAQVTEANKKEYVKLYVNYR